MNNITDLIPSVKQNWFREWFDSTFYQQLYANRDEHEAALFIDNLVLELQPEAGATMLDLGCGAGRHARQLASYGYHVTGLDLAASSIRSARNLPQHGLQFYEHDMRKPFGTERFDYIFSFFTSFGYFNGAAQNERVMNNIRCALKLRGTLVLDYLNVTFSENNIVAHEVREIDGVEYDINRWHDHSHFYKKIVVNHQHQFTERVEKLCLSDFEYLFHLNGLKMKKVFGDYALNKYDERCSPRMIIIAEKK